MSMFLAKNNTRTILIGLFLLMMNSAVAQGDSCANPIDINPFIPITGNGKYSITVDNSISNPFYTYTATQVGIIEMSSAFSNVPGDGTFDTWLRVYDENCNLIFDEDNTPGLFGGVEFVTNVAIGDTYIFEWSNQEWAGIFDVEFIYHVPVNAITCNDAQDLILGSNFADNWFGAKYYTHTATQDGLLEINTCNNPWAFGRYIEIFDACNGNLLGDFDYSCDIDDDGFQLATYQMSLGETVIIRMDSYALHMHHDYDFMASFNTALSVNEITPKTFNIYPNPFSEVLSIDLNTSVQVESLKLYDMTGKLIPVHWHTNEANSIKVNAQTMKNGAYILRINDSYSTIILKK